MTSEIAQKSTPEPSQPSLILESIRDIEVCKDLLAGTKIRADLHGLVTWRSKSTRDEYMFFRLHDSTGSIQVAAREPQLTKESIKSLQILKVYDRINVMGDIGLLDSPRRGNNQLTLFLDTVPEPLDYQLDANSTFDSLEPEIVRIGAQIFLARLRERAAHFFHDADYLELEPRYLSPTWHEGGISPLRVLYSGYGLPVYLAPSPRSQMLKALVLTGKPRVFSIAKCFTPAYRDTIVTAESPFLLAQCLNASLDDMCNLAEAAVRFVFGDVSTMPRDEAYLDCAWPRIEREWPEESHKVTSSAPELHIFKSTSGTNTGSRLVAVFQVCWPPNLVLAEGAIEKLDGTAIVGTCSLHFERLLAAIKATFRQLQDLGFVNPRNSSNV